MGPKGPVEPCGPVGPVGPVGQPLQHPFEEPENIGINMGELHPPQD